MAITINGSGTVTGLSVGGLPDGTVDSGTLATDSVTAVKIPDTVESSLKSGRKNLIINGGMEVWQRGTSASYSANTGRGYIVDRWYAEGYPLNITITKSTLTYDGISHKSASLSSITGSWAFFQAIEGARIVNHNKTMTFSFVASGSGDVQPKSWAGTIRNFGSSITLTSTPTRYEITHTLEAAATGDDLYIGFSGSGGSMNLTSVQLELGSVATDFEHRSYGEELALCQRYYQDLGRLFVQGYGYSGGTNGLGGPLLFSTTMRETPTLTKTDENHGGSYTSMVFNYPSKFGIGGLEAETTNSTQDNWVYAFVTADAEL
jgi:hypothetical protein